MFSTPISRLLAALSRADGTLEQGHLNVAGEVFESAVVRQALDEGWVRPAGEQSITLTMRGAKVLLSYRAGEVEPEEILVADTFHAGHQVLAPQRGIWQTVGGFAVHGRPMAREEALQIARQWSERTGLPIRIVERGRPEELLAAPQGVLSWQQGVRARLAFVQRR